MKEPIKLSDDELIILFQKDELAAFREIYNRYWYKLYLFTNKRLHYREASEEIIQNFFTKFWINRKEIKITESLKAYMFSSIRYSIINYMEKEATRNNYLKLACYQDEKVCNTTEEQILLHDLQSMIDQVLQKLPARCRSVFELSRKHHKSNKEIAQILNISEKTVENHITNAIKFLKLNLKESILISFLLIDSLF